MEDTVKRILEEIRKCKVELKSSIEASESNILLKVEDLKFKINSLEKENCYLKEKIEKLERNEKQNNIIIFGWDVPNKNINSEFICTELNNMLNVVVNESDINNYYCLGKTTNRPIKVEFVSYLKKREILRNCKKLKGSCITISHDLTVQQRCEYKILRKFLLRERQHNNNCYIKGNKLVIENTEFSIEDLNELDKQVEKKTNSTPSTPTQSQIVNTDHYISGKSEILHTFHPENIDLNQPRKQAENLPKSIAASKKPLKPANPALEKVTRSRSNSQK